MTIIQRGNEFNVRRQISDALTALETLTETTVDLGTVPRTGGNFTISGTGLTVGAPVIVQHASGPLGELDGDQPIARGVVETSSLIRVYWQSQSGLMGSHKFRYQVKA